MTLQWIYFLLLYHLNIRHHRDILTVGVLPSVQLLTECVTNLFSNTHYLLSLPSSSLFVLALFCTVCVAEHFLCPWWVTCCAVIPQDPPTCPTLLSSYSEMKTSYYLTISSPIFSVFSQI